MDAATGTEPPSEPATGPARRPARRRRALALTAYVVVWAACALLIGLAFFLGGSRTITLFSHDATLQPTLRGAVVVSSGPVLPDVRLDSGSVVGARVTLGKTDAPSTDALVSRYGYIASQPEGQRAKLSDALVDMALDAALRGAALGLVPVLLWLLVGRERRRDLLRRVRSRRGLGAGLIAAAVAVAVWQPWNGEPDTVDAEREWITLAEFLGPQVPLPEEVSGIEVRGDVTTASTRRLVESAIDTYDKSKQFYVRAAEAAAGLELREPDEDETVVALVSDRHDNIGMDAVARAVADAGGATGVLNGGDDTSTGRTWEAFSLDSVSEAFDDFGTDRWAVTGNHDHGGFVGDYLTDHGWTVLDGEVVDGPGGSRILGVGDPRSSGLGSWRDETGLSFDDVAERLADEACAADKDGERVATVLVHDANLGDPALERGCVDLVVGGHLHVQVGPDPVVGAGGRVGHTYTTGTTGGAAYAVAIGSKIRRTAQVSLITYRDGEPVGIQGVDLQTNGRFVVGEYTVLDEVLPELPVDGVPPEGEVPPEVSGAGPGR